MSISAELEKLQKSKTTIRKAIQRKKTGLTIAELYTNYHEYIKNMSAKAPVQEDGILDYAEDRCYSLELNVSKIRPYAFKNYHCLQQLYLPSEEIVILEDVNAFYGITPEILVPENLVLSYRSATNWSEISDRIKAYDGRVEDNMYIIQHIDRAYTVSWLETKTLANIEHEFRV